MGQCFSCEESPRRERCSWGSVCSNQGLEGGVRARLKLGSTESTRRRAKHDVVTAATAQLFLKFGRSATLRDISAHHIPSALPDLFSTSSNGISVSRTDLSLASIWESIPGLSRCSHMTGQESAFSWSSSHLPPSTQASQALGYSCLSSTGSVIAGNASFKKSITSLCPVCEMDGCMHRSTYSSEDFTSPNQNVPGQNMEQSARSRSRMYLDLVNGDTTMATSSAAPSAHSPGRQYWAHRHALMAKSRSSLNFAPGAVITTRCNDPRRIASMPRIAGPPEFSTLASQPSTGLSRFFRGDTSNLRTSAQPLVPAKMCPCGDEGMMMMPPPASVVSDPCPVGLKQAHMHRLSSCGRSDAFRRAASSTLLASHAMLRNGELGSSRSTNLSCREVSDTASDSSGPCSMTAQKVRLSSMVLKGTLQGSALAITSGVSLLPTLLKEAASVTDVTTLQQVPECEDVERPGTGHRSSRFNPAPNVTHDILGSNNRDDDVVKTAQSSCGSGSVSVADNRQGVLEGGDDVDWADPASASMLNSRCKPSHTSGDPTTHREPVSSPGAQLSALKKNIRQSPFSCTAALSYVLQPNGIVPVTASRGLLSGLLNQEQAMDPTENADLPARQSPSQHAMPLETCRTLEPPLVTNLQTGCIRSEAEAALRLACILQSRLRSDREGGDSRNSAGCTPMRTSTLGHDTLQGILGGSCDDVTTSCIGGVQGLEQQEQQQKQLERVLETPPDNIHTGSWNMMVANNSCSGRIQRKSHSWFEMSSLNTRRLQFSMPQCRQQAGMSNNSTTIANTCGVPLVDANTRTSPFAALRPSSSFVLNKDLDPEEEELCCHLPASVLDLPQRAVLQLDPGLASDVTSPLISSSSQVDNKLLCPLQNAQGKACAAEAVQQQLQNQVQQVEASFQTGAATQGGVGLAIDVTDLVQCGHVFHTGSAAATACQSGLLHDSGRHDSSCHVQSSTSRQMVGKWRCCGQLSDFHTGDASHAGTITIDATADATEYTTAGSGRRTSVGMHRHASTSLTRSLKTESGMFAVISQNLDTPCPCHSDERLPSDFVESDYELWTSDHEHCTSDYLSDSVFKYDMALTRTTPLDPCGPSVVMPVRTKKPPCDEA